jgi:hypothetical protein
VQELRTVLTHTQLGTLTVDGWGFDATATLRPSSSLAVVYRPLVEAADRRRDTARRVEFEAAVRMQIAENNEKNRRR